MRLDESTIISKNQDLEGQIRTTLGYRHVHDLGALISRVEYLVKDDFLSRDSPTAD